MCDETQKQLIRGERKIHRGNENNKNWRRERVQRNENSTRTVMNWMKTTEEQQQKRAIKQILNKWHIQFGACVFISENPGCTFRMAK